jgi:hypothetical protein
MLGSRAQLLQVGDVSQLCHALAGVLRQHTGAMAVVSETAVLTVLELCLAAVEAIPLFREQVRASALACRQWAGMWAAPVDAAAESVTPASDQPCYQEEGPDWRGPRYERALIEALWFAFSLEPTDTACFYLAGSHLPGPGLPVPPHAAAGFLPGRGHAAVATNRERRAAPRAAEPHDRAIRSASGRRRGIPARRTHRADAAGHGLLPRRGSRDGAEGPGGRLAADGGGGRLPQGISAAAAREARGRLEGGLLPCTCACRGQHPALVRPRAGTPS